MNNGLVTLSLAGAPSDGGFCIGTTANRLPDGNFAGLFEVDYLNPGSGAWVRNHDPGLWLGVSGFDHGTVCWSPSYDQNYTFFKGIQSGAQVRARQLGHFIGEYGNSNEAWLLFKDDESAWMPWSNTVTVTFSSGGGGAKGHKNHH